MSTIDKILTPEQLEAFRKGYDADWMNQTAYASVAGSFLQAGPTEQLVIRSYTTPRWPDAPVEGPAELPPPEAPIWPVPAEIPPKERERIIIALMTFRPMSSMFLAIHIYWGLMEGLSPNDIAWTQLLTGAYEGIDKYSNGIAVLSSTLTAMAAVYKTGKTDTPTVFDALAAAFTPVSQAQLAQFAKINNLKLP